VYKKYTIPLSIFIVFEHTNTVIWTSEKFYNNSYILYLNSIWFYGVNIYFKNDVFLSNSTLIENSAIDNKNNQIWVKKQADFFSANILLFYVYFFFTIKTKILLVSAYNNTQGLFYSIDKIYKSAGWLERETGEMFKINFKFKLDNRRLLLDYSKQEHPLLKEYPTEGFNDVFYNFFEDQVISNNLTVVEL